MRLALFTLPICLLPGGMTKLRIFEPRYKRLVSESLSSGRGFALCMLGENKEPMPIATRAEIIDFETLEDGLLGVTVVGRDRIAVGQWQADSDGLKHADVEVLTQWENMPVTEDHKVLADMLHKVMQQFPTQLSSYGSDEFQNLTWVCSRWLELLPVSTHHKQMCLRETDITLTLSLIHHIIKKS